MKFSKQNMIATKVKRIAMASAIVLPLTGILSGMAYAIECSPLQANRINIVDVQKVMNGSTVAGVSFRVETNLQNTSRYRVHGYNNNDQTSQRVQVARHSQQPAIDNITLRGYGSFYPNVSKRLKSDRVTVMRNPANLTDFNATIYSYVFNAECPLGKQIAQSIFKFDLNPTLNSRPAKRISARLTGYNERYSPRPRPGSGAPRPRT